MKRFFATSLLAFGLMTGAANAALLSVFGGDDATLPGDYNPLPGTVDAGPGDPIVNTSLAFLGGLKLNATANLIFTFLGKEASYVNVAFQDATLFDNTVTVGDSEAEVARNNVAPGIGGYLPFKFISNGQYDVVNGNITNPYASIAFMLLPPVNPGADLDIAMSVLVFLNDHYDGDADYDDMVIRIDAFRSGEAPTVPLPAGLVLLLSGLTGLGFLGRARAKAA